MAITVKLGILKAIEEPLIKLVKLELPIKTSYKLSKILKKIGQELADLEEERVKLVKKYGDQDDEAQSIQVKDPEKYEEFAKEFGELLQEEITLEIDPIPIDMLGDAVTFSPAELAALEMLFKDE
jgi:hypothetical protein